MGVTGCSILPVPSTPRYTGKFTTRVAESAKDSVKQEAKSMVGVRIYTDGSGIDGKAGVAVVLQNAGGPLKTSVGEVLFQTDSNSVYTKLNQAVSVLVCRVAAQ